MAKAGAMYPQAEPGAAALVERRVARCRSRAGIEEAWRIARRAGARLLLLADGSVVRSRELVRASSWQLTGLRAGDLAWKDVPAVSSRAPETRVRRLIMHGAPLVLVRDAGRVAGVIDGETVDLVPPVLSVIHRLDRSHDQASEARLWLLRVAGKTGERIGAAVFAVGGFVRDLLLDRAAPDVDLVVEGDGIRFARRLAEEVGGSLIIHPGFATASVEGAQALGGVPLGRLDVASARRERYDAPGALPVVSPAPVLEDLRRRDFTVNAMALALMPSAFGRLLDPVGGQADLHARRLRPLHPLSFVEDPTRIFRAARYAARLGFGLHPAGSAALGVALRLGDYPALSGQRLRTELQLLAAEANFRPAFGHLLRWGAFRLWDRGYRASAGSRRRLAAAERLGAWAREAGIALDRTEVALLATLLDQRPWVVNRCLERLAITGEPLSALRAAAAAAPLARRLEHGRRPSEVAEALRSCAPTVLIGAWLHGGPRARRRIQWFLTEGRGVRPLVSGDDVVALGVPRGPAVGDCLAALRKLRLDGILGTLEEEREFVKEWLHGRYQARPAHVGPRVATPRAETQKGGVR